jgi:heme/copper-type cytochrome/quinol oxidase subunit 2
MREPPMRDPLINLPMREPHPQVRKREAPDLRENMGMMMMMMLMVMVMVVMVVVVVVVVRM